VAGRLAGLKGWAARRRAPATVAEPAPADDTEPRSLAPRRLREPAERAAQLWRDGQTEAAVAAQRDVVERLSQAVGAEAEATLAARLVLARWLTERAMARLADGRPLVALRQDIERRGTGVIDIAGFESGLVAAFAEPRDDVTDLIARAEAAHGADHEITTGARDLLESIDERNVPELAARMAADAIDELLDQTRREIVNRLRAVSRWQARREAEAVLPQRRREADEALAERGPDDPVTWQAQYRLVWDLMHTGDSAGALELAESVLERRREGLGDDHADTIRSRYALACLHAERGDLGGAAKDLTGIIEDSTRVDGPAHATTLTARRVQADFIGFQGDYRRAAALAADLLHDAQELGAEPGLVDEAEAAAALWLRLA